MEMDMQRACASMLDEIDGALGCIVIDLQTGLTVAAEYRPGTAVDAAAINLVSVISTNMFRGKMIRQFESLLVRRRGEQGSLPGFVREVQMTTAATNQFMATIPGWQEGVFVLVTDKSVSLGLGWMAVHRMIGRMGAAEAAWSAQQPYARPTAAPANVEQAPAAAAASIPNELAGAAPTAVPEPYGGSLHAIARAQQTPAPGHPAPAAPPAAAPREQHAAPAAPADQDQPEPEVALGPRMNFMARRRGAKK